MSSAAHQRRFRNAVLLDIGNTRTGIAGYVDGKRGPAARVATSDADALIRAVREAWDTLPTASPRGIVASSVQPEALRKLREALTRSDLPMPLAIREDIEPPIPADVDEPDRVGSDRLCVAAAAYANVKAACVVAGFGTAVTVDLVSDNGVFLGGTISPGMALAARALHEHTALLPLVEIDAPTETLGKDTESAIRNGVFAMLVGGLREITERYATEIGKWPMLIATGGDAPAIATVCDFIDRVVPDLCLDGVALALERHLEDLDNS